MAKANRKLAEFWHLPQDLLGDEVNAPVLRPEIDLGLEPARADLDATVRRGHDYAETNGTEREAKDENIKTVFPNTLIFGMQ